MFCTELRIHRRFDLKGSSQGRSADKVEIDETTTLKDLDLKYEFRLDPSWRDSLLRYADILYIVMHCLLNVKILPLFSALLFSPSSFLSRIPTEDYHMLSTHLYRFTVYVRFLQKFEIDENMKKVEIKSLINSFSVDGVPEFLSLFISRPELW